MTLFRRFVLSLSLLLVMSVACSGPDEIVVSPTVSAMPPQGTVSQTEPSPAAAVATAKPTPTAIAISGFQVRAEVVASNLVVPWAMAFTTRLPASNKQAETGTYLFVTERPGRLRLIVDGRLLPDPVAVFPAAPTDEGGLLGLTLDPHFEQNGHLYVMYTYQDQAGIHNRISRLTLQGLKAGSEKVLLEGIPAGPIHDGGRLKFGPDGKLYATTGDTTHGDLAQRLDSLAGKILRLNADGSIPSDNPFRGSPIYSYGHRNPQGLAWQPGTGALFETEHGPSAGVEGDTCCHDEINRILPGGNYGWPIVFTIAHDPRFIDPVLESGTDTWAPSGVAFYSGDLLKLWQGNLFFGALRGHHLHRLVLGGPKMDQVTGEERLFAEEFGRIRDVAVGPDGALYFSTSNRDNRWPSAPDDDHIFRVVPAT